MNMHFRKRIISLLLLLSITTLYGCDVLNIFSRQPGEIPFKLVGVDSGACPMIMHVGQQRWNIDYFGFYLSKPEVRVDGKWQRVKFKQTKWQTPSVALLKFHALCSAPDNANDKIVLDVSEELMKLATSLRFTLGLAFDENHADPRTQPPPLNDLTMAGTQQSGHNFLRLDVSQNGGDGRHWSYHLGSMGCEAASEETAPEKPCAVSNRVAFVLPMTQLDTHLDLDVSVSNIVAQVDIREAPSCMHDHPEAWPCDKLIQNVVHRPWIKWQ